MPKQIFRSWGRVLHSESEGLDFDNRFSQIPSFSPFVPHILPYGNGRSYGDSCLNVGGGVLRTRSLDRFIHFDPVTGVLACESGVLLAEILELVVPQGWFLSVTPGTRYVSVGGSIANDVHGKNHHLAGTFGGHVRRFELLRSDGQRLHCSSDENEEWYIATIGGLGLTGIITWAELQLRRIISPWIDAETIRFANLDEFFALSAESDRDYEYTVSWLDCSGSGNRLGRGLFMRGNHATARPGPEDYHPRTRTFPVVPPFSLVNSFSNKLFNTLYYNKQRAKRIRKLQHYEQFFYPLDGMLEWNRIYGTKGFYQYQCVLATDQMLEASRALLSEIGASGLGSFLSVLKVFGTVKSPGMLSFPRPGVTLALDFPNKGQRLHALLGRLDAIVSNAGGRLYPAKDGRMSGQFFRAGYPDWEKFSNFIDPHFSSSFWRRVMEAT